MKADLEAVQKRRAFLSRTGIVALGALPAVAGLTTPRSVLAGGCEVGTLAKGGAGALVATIGGSIVWKPAAAAAGLTAPVSLPVLTALGGVAVIAIGVKIAVDSGVKKSCVEPILDELKDRIEKFGPSSSESSR